MMFAETARTLLDVLRKECTARGVITLEQLPDEIALLRAAMGDQNQPSPEQSGERDELPVGFRQRAAPFLEMLERTLRDEGYVLWEAPSAFDAA